MASGGGLPRINMANDHNVDMDLLFPHDDTGQEERMETDGAFFCLQPWKVRQRTFVHIDTNMYFHPGTQFSIRQY